jgi:transposase
LQEQRLALLAQAVAVTDEGALIESLSLRVQLICRQLQALYRTLQEFDQQLAAAYAAHPDRELYTSLPGAGAVLGPRLLASLGANRGRFGAAARLQCYSGVAPVTKRSGGSARIHRRYLCPKFHRQSFHEYANESIYYSRWAAAYYLQQRSRGGAHHTAVRALAFKWQRILWRCWQDHRPYDEAIYEAALRKHGSQLIPLFERIQLGKNPWKNHANKN